MRMSIIQFFLIFASLAVRVAIGRSFHARTSSFVPKLKSSLNFCSNEETRSRAKFYTTLRFRGGSVTGGNSTVGEDGTCSGDNSASDSFSAREEEEEICVAATNRNAKGGKRRNSSTRSSTKAKKSYPADLDSFRRIRREWRDVCLLGLGYDWVKSETVVIRRKTSKASLKGKSSTSAFSKHDSDEDLHDIPDNIDEVEGINVTGSKHRQQVDEIRIGPLGKSLYIWHFSLVGAPGSAYHGGIYHGRVILPRTYPGSPPRIQVLTPSGRFLIGHDICLSASSFHPETWTPRWTILSLVQALRIHMLTAANEIGGIEASYETRRRLAKASRSWKYSTPQALINHSQMIETEGFCVDEGTDKCQQTDTSREAKENVKDNFSSSILEGDVDSKGRRTENKRTQSSFSLEVNLSIASEKRRKSLFVPVSRGTKLRISLILFVVLFTFLNLKN